MKVFDTATKLFLIVDRKENLTPTMYIVTEMEENMIRDSLETGEVYLDGINIVISGKKPNTYSKWDRNTKSWTKDEFKFQEWLIESRNEVWKKIQEVRDNHQATGVFVEQLNKWFHTDPSQIMNYLQQSLFVNTENWQEQWKTMDNSYVTLDKEKFWEVVSAVYKKGKHDFFNAEKHRLALMQQNNPFDYDYSTGWQDSYKG